MLTEVVSVETMRKSDAYTIRKFTDSKELMLRAGKGVYNSYSWKGKTAIVCGKGNNAGDGYVLALQLKEAGIDCVLFLLEEKFSADGKYYFDQCMEQSVPYVLCDKNTDFNGYSEIVDCIYGTGFKGKVSGIAEIIIDKINESEAYVISVDINSGLDGDWGVYEKCVHSDLTVSIGYYKTGHFFNQASECIKELVNCDIGIKRAGEVYYLADHSICELENLLFFENFSVYLEYLDNCMSYLDPNPAQVISDSTEFLANDLYVCGFGDYSVYATPDATYLIKE